MINFGLETLNAILAEQSVEQVQPVSEVVTAPDVVVDTPVQQPATDVAVSAGLWLFVKDWVVFELFKHYVDYLIDNDIVTTFARSDSAKEACVDVVGKAVSTLMDRGECTIATWDRIRNYIEQRPILVADQTESSALDLFTGKLLCAVMNYCGVSLVNGATGNIADGEKDIVNKFLAAKDAYELACREVMVLLKQPTVEFVKKLVTNYTGVLDASFVDKMNSKIKSNLIEYKQP